MPVFKAIMESGLKEKIAFCVDPADGVRKLSPNSGWGNAGRAFVVEVLEKTVAYIEKNYSIEDQEEEKDRLLAEVDKHQKALESIPEFDEEMVVAIKVQELQKMAANALDAVWDADRWQGIWTATSDAEMEGSENLMRFKRCGGKWEESAPFVDIWMLQALRPKEFATYKEQVEIPLRDRFIHALLSYNARARGPSINTPKELHAVLIATDLKDKNADFLGKIAYETLEKGALDATFLAEMRIIREEIAGGNLVHFSLDDCSNTSETHNLSKVGVSCFALAKPLYNSAKVDGDFVAKLTCSSSKAGFVMKEHFKRVTEEGTLERELWEKEVEVFANSLKSIARATFPLEFSLHIENPHHLHLAKEMYEKHNILMLGGDYVKAICGSGGLGDKVLAINWDRFLIQGGIFGAAAFPMKAFVSALQFAVTDIEAAAMTRG